MTIDGYWFEVGSSTRQEARLVCKGDAYQLFLADQEPARAGVLSEVNVSSRVGNIARKLYWDDDSLFETLDNDAVDQVLEQANHRDKKSHVIHRMESSKTWVAIALVATVILGVLFFKVGLPSGAGFIANKMPIGATEAISKNALKNMDRFIFDESELSDEAQSKWQAQFDSIVSQVDTKGFDLTLHFRQLGVPNAMALPGGDIIVTDEFIELIDDPGEFDGVLLHEVAHVVERHGLQQVIQASTLTIIIALATGDVSGAGELAVSLPVFLTKSNYSRQSENSADEYAFVQMMDLGIDPTHFASIILKLGELDESDLEPSDDSESASMDESDRRLGYLSTHPATKNRALRALELSKAFNGDQ